MILIPLAKKIDTLREFCTTKLEDCDSEEDYVTKITELAHKLNSNKIEMSDALIGYVLLMGLPSEYRPMVMTITNSDKKLTSDLVKTKILEEVKFFSTQQDVKSFYVQERASSFRGRYQRGSFRINRRRGYNSRGQSFVNNRGVQGPRCYSCNGRGHISSVWIRACQIIIMFKKQRAQLIK